MMQAAAKIFELPLQHAFGISRETRTVQKTFIVRLTYNGIHGYGEATENKYYRITVGELTEQWENIRSEIEKWKPAPPSCLTKELLRLTGNNRFLMAAVDEALWDLYGKINRHKNVDYLFPGWKNLPVSSYTIGIDTVEKMKEKILEKPWPVYKIKLGTPHDLEIIRELRQVTDKPFRVDANAAWDFDKAKNIIPRLAELNVEFVEQPLPAAAYADTRRLKEISPLPLIADEACVTEADLEKAFDAYHGINVKLTKAGGMTVGLQMLEAARKAGKMRMIGCMTESSVGISAAAQLLPTVQFADLDGPLLIAKDIAEGVKVKSDGYVFPEIGGNGVRMEAF